MDRKARRGLEFRGLGHGLKLCLLGLGLEYYGLGLGHEILVLFTSLLWHPSADAVEP